MTDRLAERVGERKGLAIGLVLAITMIAFENLGVSTAMPIVARDLHGLSLYGWAFTAPLLASLIGIAVAGRIVDRMGPGRPFAGGLALFTVGLATAGLATNMSVLVAGRFVQGLGTGVIPPVAYAAIGRAFGDRARARMFALLSTAWVLPGLIGPTISGRVAEQFNWRWVFLAILPLAPLNALLALPALHHLGAPPTEHEGDADPEANQDDQGSWFRGPIGSAVLLAVGTGLVVAGLGWLSPIAALLVVAGLALAIPPLRRLLPRGTFHAAPGLPAAVAARGLQTFAFFGAQNFLTLALVELRGQKADVAGLSLVGATLSWTAGAWLQDRVGHVWGRRVMVARGFALLLVGAATTSLLLFPSVPAFIAALGWAIAGLGMGMAYGGLSLIVLAEAPPGKEGTATSAMQLSDVFGMAIGTGLGGAALALGEAALHSARPGVTVAFALSIAAAALAFAAARRLPGVADDSPHGPSAATIQPAV